jgi:DNA helicase HerA-like ATPase
MNELDEFFPRDTENRPLDLADFPLSATPADPRTPLGVVVSGALSKGLQVKLTSQQDASEAIEQMAVGRYVVVTGQTGRKFFSLVTDISLDSTAKELPQRPPSESPFRASIYRGNVAYGIANVSPMLMLDPGDSKPRPVKTIPAHFSPVYEATEADVQAVFGAADDDHFHIGTPLDMEQVKVYLNLDRFVERSSGIFGKSGTGKSFVTRTLLAGVIARKKASALIFDMHNDYGWAVQNERTQEFKGLRQLFPHGEVAVFTLDDPTSRARGSKTDGTVQIPFTDVEAGDVEMLAGVLSLSDVQVGALYYLERELGKQWIQKLISDKKEDGDEIAELLEKGQLMKGTLGAMQRKFEAFRRMDFLVPKVSTDTVENIFTKLSNGTSVVLEFGRHGDNLQAYMLVANYLTRRIHRRYVDAKNKAIGGQGAKPNPLMIVVEEAHKFLTPELAEHTIFGTIARELRKYNVTLLIVDQRPSAIDDEVMSQIGTRVTCLLDNEADIRAVFSGVSGASQLREVLARLDTQQQALILGHAVPMPVVIRTRNYDIELYAEISPSQFAPKPVSPSKSDEETALWG